MRARFGRSTSKHQKLARRRCSKVSWIDDCLRNSESICSVGRPVGTALHFVRVGSERMRLSRCPFRAVRGQSGRKAPLGTLRSTTRGQSKTAVWNLGQEPRSTGLACAARAPRSPVKREPVCRLGSSGTTWSSAQLRDEQTTRQVLVVPPAQPLTDVTWLPPPPTTQEAVTRCRCGEVSRLPDVVRAAGHSIQTILLHRGRTPCPQRPSACVYPTEQAQRKREEGDGLRIF